VASEDRKVHPWPSELLGFPEIKIEIDEARCTDGGRIPPMECGICLNTCPLAIFALASEVKEGAPYQEANRKLGVLAEWRCMGCGDCVEACPRGAISLKVGEPPRWLDDVRGYTREQMREAARKTGYGLVT